MLVDVVLAVADRGFSSDALALRPFFGLSGLAM